MVDSFIYDVPFPDSILPLRLDPYLDGYRIPILRVAFSHPIDVRFFVYHARIHRRYAASVFIALSYEEYDFPKAHLK